MPGRTPAVAPRLPGDLYTAVRDAEGLNFLPDAVRRLPEVDAGSPAASVWRIRGSTLARIRAELVRSGARRVLDLGCGNGWLAARLAELTGDVVGVDGSAEELQVAAAAFRGRRDVRFVRADVRSPPFRPGTFDAVVVAGVLQYVPDAGAVLRAALSMVKPDGDVLVAETPFYRPGEISGARARTEAHYASLAHPEMAAWFHHHAWDVLLPYGPEMLHVPHSWRSRIARKVLRRPLSPFAILRLRHAPGASRPWGDGLRHRVLYTASKLLARRSFHVEGASVEVADGVLNPSMFPSSLWFAREALAQAPAAPARVLELGCGAGLASVLLARAGHDVVAVDADGAAVACTLANAARSGVRIRALVSHWDAALPAPGRFDYVIANPPFLREVPPALRLALWAGPDLAAVDAALGAMGRRLAPGGRGLLMTSERSGRPRVEELVSRHGLRSEACPVRRIRGETYAVDVLGLAT